MGSIAEASVLWQQRAAQSKARLRQISDAANSLTRTYEARYVLEGDAAEAPLGSTVTIKISNSERPSEVAVPIGAVLDDGSRTGVWILDPRFLNRALRSHPD